MQFSHIGYLLLSKRGETPRFTYAAFVSNFLQWQNYNTDFLCNINYSIHNGPLKPVHSAYYSICTHHPCMCTSFCKTEWHVNKILSVISVLIEKQFCMLWMIIQQKKSFTYDITDTYSLYRVKPGVSERSVSLENNVIILEPGSRVFEVWWID